MVVGEVPEEDIPRVQDVQVVLEKPLFIQARLVDLALRSILLDEPVVPQRLRILLFGDPHDLRCLRCESFQLTWPDLQVSVQFKMGHNSSSNAFRDEPHDSGARWYGKRTGGRPRSLMRRPSLAA